MRLLLLNTFDLVEDAISMDSVLEWTEKLNTTYPEQFAQIADKVREGECNLEKELDTVSYTHLHTVTTQETLLSYKIMESWKLLKSGRKRETINDQRLSPRVWSYSQVHTFLDHDTISVIWPLYTTPVYFK